MKSVKPACLVVLGLIAFTVPASSEVLIAQANQRMLLSKQIKTQAYEFAGDPGNYARVQKITDLAWDLIAASDQKASCAIAAKDLTVHIFHLNFTYTSTVQTMSGMDTKSLLTTEFGEMMEQQLSGYKKEIAFDLEKLAQYCN